uniref:ATG16 family protein n=1 Tax=Roseihalotalea indica TaxID=2867963 RepID=A0AA49GUI5_9BACT|nr:ATG16 family protein [Tunicatimonas sp. TK19036]
MEKRIHSFFEKIAESLFTLPPIMVGMFAMYAYLVYESQALLITQLPITLTGWHREAAAWFLSVAIHLTILTTAANSKLVHQAFPVLFAMAGYFITTLFFDAWNFGKPPKGIFVSQLFSLLIAVINYLFVYLFVGKWKELKGAQAHNQALQQAEQTVTRLNEELTTAHQTLTSHQTQLTKRNEELKESKQALTELQQTLTKQQRTHQEELQLVAENRMCITCGFKADSYQQLSRYKRDCNLCIRQRKAKKNATQSVSSSHAQ